MTGRQRDPAASPDALGDERRPAATPAPERPPDVADAPASSEDSAAAKKRARKRRAPFVL
jgi:hypothetical protein